ISARLLAGDGALLAEHDRHAALGEEERGRSADDTTADDDDFGLGRKLGYSLDGIGAWGHQTALLSHGSHALRFFAFLYTGCRPRRHDKLLQRCGEHPGCEAKNYGASIGRVLAGSSPRASLRFAQPGHDDARCHCGAETRFLSAARVSWVS